MGWNDDGTEGSGMGTELQTPPDYMQQQGVRDYMQSPGLDSGFQDTGGNL
jgi:hypothetical protein